MWNAFKVSAKPSLSLSRSRLSTLTAAPHRSLKTSIPIIATMAPASRRANSSLPAGYVEDKSKGATLRFQDSLPRLPVPTLEETAARYIKSLKPILSNAEFEKSKAAVAEFVKPGGVGEKLQKKLLARRNDPNVKNWLYEWWNDLAYLKYRDPVVPYVSYFYAHRDTHQKPARRAAELVTGALEFKQQLESGTLEPDYLGKFPMCMDSFKWMFNCSRVAAKPADYPIKFPADQNKHIVVVRKNQFFKVPYEVDGQQLTANELEKQFERIYEVATEAIPPVGALTSENRDIWTDARATLLSADSGNAAALETIESSAFLVCLDDASPVTYEERAHQFWHGDGANRWYDKPLQFIVNDNGTSGFMGEHSMMDGTPTHRLNDYVNHVIFTKKLDLSNTNVRSTLAPPEPIKFVVNEAVKTEIDRAVTDFHDVIGKHELAVQAYKGYGKNLIKKFKSSPDAFVQMVIQLAYYKMYGVNRPTYESATTRRFQQGRTETCRTVSEESVAWCKAMEDPKVSNDEKIKLFRAAHNAQVEYIGSATQGKGVDRHLLGLKMLLEPGQEVPAIFKDPAYTYSSSWYLSTSQLSSEYFNGYGWSQVIDQGFGIAYMVNQDSLNFNVVSKKLGSDKMRYYLGEAADDMRALLVPTITEPVKAKL